ncbi:MAG: hypothetical protein KDA96_10980 [Planctomycetaceae bacterium]|nr:hypothetical protein [Planctomycetaceae bacterium]
MGSARSLPTTASSSPVAPATARLDVAVGVVYHRVMLLALVLLLVVSLPIVVCMPLTSDTVLYDLQARTVLSGGILYRDILEPNLPGIVWCHLLIRSVVGWSSEAMRIVDLLTVGTACLLLTILFCPKPLRSAKALVSATPTLLSLSLFYLTRNEWCHCQRDSWLLLPTAFALAIRIRRSETDSFRLRMCLSVFEGCCWGLAFWLKPHIALTVAAVVVVDVIRPQNRRRQPADLSGIVTGGILVAIPGILWLVRSGAWEHFLEMQLDWNPEYLASGRERRTLERLVLMGIRFSPWWLIHVVAVSVAVRKLWLSLFGVEREMSRTPLLAAVYLSWLLQTALLQLAMDYIHVPAILLGIVLIRSVDWELPIPVQRLVVGGFLLLATLTAPQFEPQRLRLWADCFSEGSTWENRESLSCGRFPDWKHLDQVSNFLKTQGVQRHDVTCFNVHCIHVYERLNLLPSTRYVGISSLLELFPSREAEIREAVENAPARFVVADLEESAEVPGTFPYDQQLAFSAGAFRVYEVRGSRQPGFQPAVIPPPM